MADILERIAATKRQEVEAMKRILPLEVIRHSALNTARKPLSMSESIKNRPTAVIAEHKRRSPSRGEIAPMSSVAEIAEAYSKSGAAAMSVLTDTPYFGGSIADLAVARMAAPSLPILRKEFIVDPWQIYQARVWGADAVLLIASMLSAGELDEFNDLAHALGMETLVEVHNAGEIAKVPATADMVGVNNRDLRTFSTDIANSASLLDRLPQGPLKVAESGLKTPADVARLKAAGFDAFLIGEALMSTPDPGAALRRFLSLKS